MNGNPYSAPKVQYDKATQSWTSDIPTEGGIDPKKGELLSFGNGNSKLKALRKAAAAELNVPVSRVRILPLTLPAGWSCPGADECLAFADPVTGKIWDSPELKFRCFEASAERYENVRQQNWHNFNLVRSTSNSHETAGLILRSLKEATKKFKSDDVVIVRIHVGGDFYSEEYFKGWARALRATEVWDMPKIIGYAYTKSIHHLRQLDIKIPKNFVLTASEGGRFDHLIPETSVAIRSYDIDGQIQSEGLKVAKVVFSPEQAQSEGLEIDHDDSHAVFGKESFGLLIHGTQPKGSQSAKALSSLKARGVDSGYSN